jgi:hypothetical protein
LIIGMRAKPTAKEQPDLIQSPQEVTDTSAVKSRVLDLIGQLVEPPIAGVEAHEFKHPENSKSGFVVVYIPASEGFPRRSRKDWKFYLRIGSGTFPMEYFQIADMFGKRPQPNLELWLEPDPNIATAPPDARPHQFWWLGLSNVGRGIAKFPSLRFRRNGHGLVVAHFGIDGIGGHALPLRPSESEWVVFRGGVDDVIYPNSTLKITKLRRPFTRKHQLSDTYIWDKANFSVEISCEGMPSRTIENVIPERHYNSP